MTKHILDNAMVAHVWVQQTQDTARSNNGNFHFTGDTLYSYATPIARIHQVPGSRVVLATSEHFSATTEGKHKNALTRATDYGRNPRMFVVPFIGASGGRGFRGPTDLAQCHAGNLAFLLARYEAEKDRLLRVRHDPEDYAWEHFGTIADGAIEYARVFGLPEIELHTIADRAAIVAQRADKAAKYNTPEAKARREKAAADRVKWLEAIWAKATAEWRAGTGSWHTLPQAIPVMLRQRGESIETSRGASFPVDHGRKAFAFISQCRMAGRAWHRNGHSVHLGAFTLDEIASNGDVKAGCHFVEWAEIERMARALGILGEVAA